MATIGAVVSTSSPTGLLQAIADYFRAKPTRRSKEVDVWTHGARGL